MSWLRCRYWSRSFWVDGLINWIVERISLINWTVLLVSRVIYFYYSIYYYHYSTQLKVSAYSLNDHKYVYFWQQLCWNKELKHVTTVVNLCILCWLFSNQDLPALWISSFIQAWGLRLFYRSHSSQQDLFASQPSASSTRSASAIPSASTTPSTPRRTQYTIPPHCSLWHFLIRFKLAFITKALHS